MLHKRLLILLQLFVSCLSGAFAVACIAVPNDLAVTGTSGLAIAISKIIPLDYTLIYYLITMIISFFAWIYLGKEEVAKIVFLVFMFPLTMYFARFIPFQLSLNNKLVAVILFGIFFGISYGFAYRSGFSYGASDTIAKILKHTILKHISLKQIMNILEGFIVITLFWVYDFKSVVYALIGAIVCVQIMNMIVFAKTSTN